MIQVNVNTHDDGFMDINIQGHAQERVCSAVSTLLQSSVNYMVELEKEYPDEIQVNIKGDE